MKTLCKTCHKHWHDTRFDECFDCHALRLATTYQEIQDSYDDLDRDIPESEYCVMCGREWGTALRKDGKYYCSTCWTVWNS